MRKTLLALFAASTLLLSGHVIAGDRAKSAPDFSYLEIKKTATTCEHRKGQVVIFRVDFQDDISDATARLQIMDAILDATNTSIIPAYSFADEAKHIYEIPIYIGGGKGQFFSSPAANTILTNFLQYPLVESASIVKTWPVLRIRAKVTLTDETFSDKITHKNAWFRKASHKVCAVGIYASKSDIFVVPYVQQLDERTFILEIERGIDGVFDLTDERTEEHMIAYLKEAFLNVERFPLAKSK